MSDELPLVSQVMYFREGEVEPGDEAKVERLERKLWDWKRDVLARVGKGLPTLSREDMASHMVQVENNLEGYWCKGEKCMSSSRTHWVLDGNRNNERAWSAQNQIDKENLPVVIRRKDENT
jgi:hypothetical protein